jgi:hypothetical protein
MSKLLRLPLVLLIALVMALVWWAPASADPPTTPTAEDCLESPELDGCQPGDPAAGDSGSGDGTGGDGTGGSDAVAAFPGPIALVDPPTCDDLPTDVLPDCPEPPTCDDLPSEVLPDCPAPPTCDDLPTDVLPDCPEIPSPPGEPLTCDQLVDLFELPECPEVPTSCEDVADLLGLGGCEQIPCLDTSQLPDEAKEGLAPLLEGLAQIGIEACPPEPVTGGGNDGGGNPSPGQQPGQQPVRYENCDDARAKGKAPVYSTDAGYRSELDSDHDGIGCEETVTYAAPVHTQSAGKLAYTGIDLELWLRAGAILLSSGTLLLLAGRRA